MIHKVNTEVEESIKAIEINNKTIMDQEIYLKNTEKAFSDINNAMQVVEGDMNGIFSKINELTLLSETVTFLL